MPHIENSTQVIDACRKLADGARLLGVPVFVTEQYPKGLGATVEPLRGHAANRQEKLRFGAFESLGWGESSPDDSRHRIMVAGVEAHVCVQQTVLELIAYGYRVYVAADAVGSRHAVDREWALQRMLASGAIVTTSESLLFEWCETAEAPEFKALSRLVTGR